MKHFSAALHDSIHALKDPNLLALCERICLMVDIEGRFRILAELIDGTDEASFKTELDANFKTMAGDYWSSDEIWFDGKSILPADKAIYSAVWQSAEKDPVEPRIHLLHRRISKQTWFEEAGSPPWPLKDQTPPILSFYSFKGGVGRSTSLAAVAIQQARKGKRVLLLDFDLEAPGLMSIFPPPEGVQPEVGLVDYLLEKPILDQSLHLEDFYYRYANAKVIGDQGGEIIVLPAGLVDANYLEKLARINFRQLQSSPASDQEGTSLLRSLFKELKKQLAPDVLLIDSRAGLHDLGGLALSPLVHRHILFGLDSDQSWRGIQLAVRQLGRNRIEEGACQQESFLVQCMVSTDQAIRERSVRRFLEKAHEVFSEDYYAAEPNEGDDNWFGVQDLNAPDAPHYPIVLKHSAEVMGYHAIADATEVLTTGDFKTLGNRILPESS